MTQPFGLLWFGYETDAHCELKEWKIYWRELIAFWQKIGRFRHKKGHFSKIQDFVQVSEGFQKGVLKYWALKLLEQQRPLYALCGVPNKGEKEA